jgi:ABC transporter ATM
MLSPPKLRLALHVGNVVSQVRFSTPGARHTIRKVCFGSGIHYKSPLLVETNLQIRPLSSFLSKGCGCRRWFQHKPPLQKGSLSPPTPQLSSKPSPLKKDSDFATKGDIPTLAEQRRSDWGITKRLLVNVWPKNDWKTRWIVLLGFGLLVSSKV